MKIGSKGQKLRNLFYLELLTVYTPFLRLVRLADWRISEILADRPIGRFDLKHGYYEWES